MRKAVTIWTEGGSLIGMGHVVRCINIAKALDRLDIPVHFLVNNDPAVTARLKKEGLFYLTYPVEGADASKLTNDVVVIDTKKDVSKQVRALKESGKKVVLIDNYSAEGDKLILPYASLKGRKVNENTSAGNPYVIIGEHFHKARETRPGLSFGLPLKVLVTMGGADPNNLTGTVVKALSEVRDIEVIVAIGPAAKASLKLKRLEGKKKSPFTFMYGVTDLAPLMSVSHLAFTAVGTTIYELAYMGVPSVLIANYSEDSADLEELDSMNVSVSLGYYKNVSEGQIIEAVEGFKNAPGKWELMSTRARALTDGMGGQRIAGMIADLCGDDSQTKISRTV